MDCVKLGNPMFWLEKLLSISPQLLGEDGYKLELIEKRRT